MSQSPKKIEETNVTRGKWEESNQDRKPQRSLLFPKKVVPKSEKQPEESKPKSPERNPPDLSPPSPPEPKKNGTESKKSEDKSSEIPKQLLIGSSDSVYLYTAPRKLSLAQPSQDTSLSPYASSTESYSRMVQDTSLLPLKRSQIFDTDRALPGGQIRRTIKVRKSALKDATDAEVKSILCKAFLIVHSHLHEVREKARSPMDILASEEQKGNVLIQVISQKDRYNTTFAIRAQALLNLSHLSTCCTPTACGTSTIHARHLSRVSTVSTVVMAKKDSVSSLKDSSPRQRLHHIWRPKVSSL